MKDRSFLVILIVVAAVGILLTAAHFAYAAQAYQHASIIEFIAKEIW